MKGVDLYMKKKVLITTGIVIIILFVIGLVTSFKDSARVRAGIEPKYVIKTISSNGNKVTYWGLGYKVIRYVDVSPNEPFKNSRYVKYGSWFMKYDEFKPEDLTVSEIVKDKEYVKELDDIVIKFNLPNEWNYEEINDSENQNAKFELKLYKDSKAKSASLFYYKDMFGVCGTGLTSKKLSLDSQMEANVGYYDGSNIWTFVSFYNSNPNIAFWNYGLDENDANELLGIIKTITIKENFSFYGKVIESNEKTIIVEPNENEAIRKSADKIAIGLGEKNDMIYMVGTNVKITYDGTVMETYPAQVNAIKIELKSADQFNLVFYQKTNIKPKQREVILNKGEIENVDYNVYTFEGHVAINLNSDNLELSENSISLRDALLQGKITMDEIIAKANKDLEENKITGDMFKDGGTMIYKYDNYTIIKCHTVGGNRDVYIGSQDMKISDFGE